MFSHIEKERIVRKNIIEIFKENFSASLTEDEILNIIPEEKFDNFSSYYESILDIFLIDTEYEQSIRGKVKDTVSKVVKLWSKTPYSYCT